MRKYNKDIHARRLREGLKRWENGDDFCPAAKNYDSGENPFELWSGYSQPCMICRKFIGLPTGSAYKQRCPCHQLGCDVAIALAYQALKAYDNGTELMPIKDMDKKFWQSIALIEGKEQDDA